MCTLNDLSRMKSFEARENEREKASFFICNRRCDINRVNSSQPCDSSLVYRRIKPRASKVATRYKPMYVTARAFFTRGYATFPPLIHRDTSDLHIYQFHFVRERASVRSPFTARAASTWAWRKGGEKWGMRIHHHGT